MGDLKGLRKACSIARESRKHRLRPFCSLPHQRGQSCGDRTANEADAQPFRPRPRLEACPALR